MTTTTKRKIAWNFAAAATDGRSTLLLLFVVLAAASGHASENYNELTTTTTTQRYLTPLGSIISTQITQRRNTVYDFHPKFLRRMELQRENTSASIIDFEFDMRRMRVLSKPAVLISSNKGVMYWMIRDHRVQDNWALLYAQKLAIQHKVPLHVVFFKPKIVVDTTTFRQYKFMIEGLRQVGFECRDLNIEFHFLIGNSTDTLSHFIRNHTLGEIVVDFSPLRDDINMVSQLVLDIGSKVPIIQIDAHNILPCWLMADFQPHSRIILRKNMERKFDTYFTEFPPVIKHPYTANPKTRHIGWSNMMDKINRINQTIPDLKAGYFPAMKVLNIFVTHKLPKYFKNRINPLLNGLSNLSPWLHFGQISAQRVLLEVMKSNDSYVLSVNMYKYELFFKRELMENYCYYNSKYDSFEGGTPWGRDTLNKHRNDTRKQLYTREQLENSQTIDHLWNAANNQMKKEGKTHQLLRPYWAKKILEFSKTPEEAIATANYLNNKYSLDGNDPSGFGGIMWAMTGVYDNECSERTIFGKIRYISSMELHVRINAYAYICKHSGVIFGERNKTFTPS